MPATLGPYQLVRRLGYGGTAEVHLAIAHGASGFAREVAIKTLLPELADDTRCVRRLIREATLAARLRHRNLVGVHAFGLDEGRYYLVMEYVDGGDLTHAAMPEPLALHVACEIALGLAYLHAARDERGLPLGLVHRDLSPANVLVSTTGDVKLTDLGVSKATALADHTEAGALRGTYAYMAPEQVCAREVSHATDQWGLAILLAELITGVRVFVGDNPLAIAQAIVAGPQRLAGIAADVRHIIERATAQEPAQRYPSIEDMRRDLELVRRGRPATPGRGIAGAAELGRWVQARRRP